MGSPPPSPGAKLDTKPLTYGVELEMVLAFYQDRLHLSTTNGIPDTIEKGIKLADREIRPLTMIRMPNRAYNSWGIVRADSGRGRYRTEPLQVVADVIEQECGLSNHVLTADSLLPTDKKAHRYDNWMVTNDHSVCGVGSNHIPKWLPNRVRHANSENWDSYGVEIVSPMLYSDSKKDADEIARIVKAVKGTDTDRYGGFITNQCGLHVHVQAPKDHKVLYMLAFIVLIYEDEISRLHPPCRRPEHEAAKYNIESNRLGAMAPDEDITIRQFQQIDCSSAAISKRYTMEALKDYLDNGIRSQDPVFAMARLMNCPHSRSHPPDRNRLVNFTSATRDQDYSYTIEFRQARGTLSAQDVSRWVDFCIGLVRLAGLYLANPSRLKVNDWEDYFDNGGIIRNNINVFDLMYDMELDDDAIHYWETRVARYMCGAKGDADDRTDNEVRPEDDPEDSEGKVSGDDDNGGDDAAKKDAEKKAAEKKAVDDRKAAKKKVEDDRKAAEKKAKEEKEGKEMNESAAEELKRLQDERKLDIESTLNAMLKNSKAAEGSAAEKMVEDDKIVAEKTGEDKAAAGAKSVAGQNLSASPPASPPPPPPTETNVPIDSNTEQETTDKETSAPKDMSLANENTSPPATESGKGNLDVKTTLDNLMKAFLSPTPGTPSPTLDAATQALVNQFISAPITHTEFVPIPETEPVPAPYRPGEIASEGMHHDGHSWVVTGFNLNDWNIERTSSSFGNRTYVCGAIALHQAMRAQYPESRFARAELRQVLAILDHVSKPTRNWHFEDQVDEALREWTNGEFKLVVSKREDVLGAARRVGHTDQQTRKGTNLFLRHSGSGKSAHWESMRKRH